MRADNPTLPSASPVALIRAQLARARRSVGTRRPAVRWLGAAAVAAVLAALGYLATMPAAGKYLGEGHQYPADDIAEITRNLDAQHIDYRVEDRRIGVASDRYSDAMEVVAKLDLGPRTIAEIRKQSHESDLWLPFNEKERLEFRRKEEILEAMIRSLDGIVSACVTIHRTRARVGLQRPTTTATAFVWLETRDDRAIGDKTVQGIKGIIVGNEPDLKADAVAVWDRKGRKYLDPRNPELDEISRTRARQEEIAQKILDDLNWIKGAEVTVQLVAAPMTATSTTTAEPTPLPSATTAPAEPPTAPAQADEPQVGVNQPVDELVPPLERRPEPDPGPTSPAVEPPRPAVEPRFARVWVKVPRSFYYQKALPNRNPSLVDLESIRGRTESIIKTAVGYVLPPETFEVSIATIPDDVVLRDPTVAPAVRETWRWPSWWIPAASGGATAAVLLALGLRWLATRRPRAVPSASARQARYEAEPGPGSSERVRELIRHNPEAAASVLHRWIGQGGHTA